MTVKKAAPKAAPKAETNTLTAASVYVHDPESGDTILYSKGDVVPAEHRKLIGDHCFEQPDDE
jgi:hypothetical protein